MNGVETELMTEQEFRHREIDKRKRFMERSSSLMTRLNGLLQEAFTEGIIPRRVAVLNPGDDDPAGRQMGIIPSHRIGIDWFGHWE